MLCPTCKRDDVAEGRKLCWGCLETVLDAVKVNCEGRSKVTPYIPMLEKNPSPYKTRMRRQSYRVDHRSGGRS